MIGMVNVPCDSPIDFYASAPKKQESVRIRATSESHATATPSRHNSAKRTPSYRPLFTSHKKKIQYLEDGRRVTDGENREIPEPNKLWEELLLRSFAQKIEIEIQSPVADQYKTLDSELEKLNVRDKSMYSSTYSLVSPHRAESLDPAYLVDNVETKSARSASVDHSFSHFLRIPFITSIKGNKKKNSKK
ncbi:hypothetical protein WR25_24713 [Diploscapter pachys]|uniref:Uncharacterized protein n=1 Tax=Diploscapter pachys TaxID=2018661 RepID=A0A2A2L986_9BILA|nr:hypothetical protein WR25_24713 [Diploscapter pachys]